MSTTSVRFSNNPPPSGDLSGLTHRTNKVGSNQSTAAVMTNRMRLEPFINQLNPDEVSLDQKICPREAAPWPSI